MPPTAPTLWTVPGHDGGTSLGERLAGGEAGHEAVEARLLVERLMEDLPERERRILELRFVDELSQSEIASRIGVSQMHVSRLLRKTLIAMREQLASLP